MTKDFGSEKIGPTPNAYAAYTPEATIPLGVVKKWNPIVTLRTLIDGKVIGEGAPQSIKDMIINPATYSFFYRSYKTLHSPLIRTVYGKEESKQGALQDKIVTAPLSDPKVFKNTAWEFGLWNAQYKGDYSLSFSGQLDINGNSYPFMYCSVKIKTTKPEVELKVGSLVSKPTFNALNSQIGICANQLEDGVCNHKNNGVYLEYEIKGGQTVAKNYNFGYIQIAEEFTINLFSKKDKERRGLLISKEDMLDVDPGSSSTGIYSCDDVFQLGSCILKDAPRETLFPYLYKNSDNAIPPLCSNIEKYKSDKNPLKEHFDNSTDAKYALRFSTYLMMQGHKSSSDCKNNICNWIPIKKVAWSMDVEAECKSAKQGINPAACGLGTGLNPKTSPWSPTKLDSSGPFESDSSKGDWTPPFWSGNAQPYLGPAYYLPLDGLPADSQGNALCYKELPQIEEF